MRFRPPKSLVPRWWWVFGLFIATPAIVLAVLGLGVIRVDEIQRRSLFAEQQAQLARLTNAALSTALQREIDDARRRSRTPGAALSGDVTHFELEANRTVAFPALRVYVLSAGVAPPAWTAPELPHAEVLLVERAQAAEAQGHLLEARTLYEQLRPSDRTRDWADLQLSMLPTTSDTGAGPSAVPVATLADSDARAPSGIPLAIVASSYSEGGSNRVRARFLPLLEQTLRNLRAGRWWMSLSQRRVYDDELRRWIHDARPATPVRAPDPQLEVLAGVAALAVADLDVMGGVPTPAHFVGSGPQRHLLVWMHPDREMPKWSGVAIPSERAEALIASTVRPLLKEQSFQVSLRQGHEEIWRTGAHPSASGPSLSLDAMRGWSLAFTDVPPSSMDLRRLLNYARVVFPVVVLACGLAMTGWIVRREMALREMQAAFAAAVTHEFKSPITSIRLLMERITSGRLQSADATERYYAAIRTETDRLDALVNRLLEAQKLQAGQKDYVFHPAAIDAIVRQVVDAMRPQAEAKQIVIDLQVVPHLPTLALDTASIDDAIRNLLDNAIKYSPERGRVSVVLAVRDGEVRLDVSDEGIGVDPREADRIFEPFYRSRRGDHINVHGTGLGLSLVKATAEAHDGVVLVTSDGVRGSQFTLVLPFRHASSLPEPEQAPEASTPLRTTPR